MKKENTMNTASNKKHHVLKFLSALLLLFCLTSVSDVRDTSASKLTSTSFVESIVDPIRQRMLDIAYLYANHRWTATITNIIQSRI